MSDTDTLLTLETSDDGPLRFEHLEKSVDVLINGKTQISYQEFKLRLENEFGILDTEFVDDIFEEYDMERKGYLTRRDCLNLLAGAERDVKGEDLDDEESLTLDFEHMNRRYREKVNVSSINFMQDALDPLLVEDLQEKINRLQATGLSMEEIRYLLKLKSNTTLSLNGGGRLQPLRMKNGGNLNRSASAGNKAPRRSKSAGRSMSVVRRSRSLARDKPKNGSTKKSSDKRRQRSSSAHRRVIPRASVSERSMQTRSRPRSIPREFMNRQNDRHSPTSTSPSVLTWDPKYNPVGKRRNFHTYNYLSFYAEMAQLRDKMLIKGETIDAQSLRYGLFQLGLDLSDFDIQLILTKLPSRDFEDFSIYFIHTKHSGAKLQTLQRRVIKAMVYSGINVDALTLPELDSWVELDDGVTGNVRWIGKIPRNDSVWVGIELEKHHKRGGNGNLRGKQYFKCKPGMGVFVRSHRIQKIVVK